MAPMPKPISAGTLLLLFAAALSCHVNPAQAGRVLSTAQLKAGRVQSLSLTSSSVHTSGRSLISSAQPLVMSYAAPNLTRPVPSCFPNAPRAQLWANGNYTEQNRPVKDDSLFDLMIDICNFIGQYYAGEGGCCSAVDLYGDSFLAQQTIWNGRSVSAYPVLTPLPGYQFNQLGYSNWEIIDTQNFICSNVDRNSPSPLTCSHSWSKAQGSAITIDNSVTVGRSSTTSWSISVDFDFVSSSSSYSYTMSTDWSQGVSKAFDNTITQTYETSTTVAPGNCTSLYLEVVQRQAYGELVTQAELSNYVIFFGAGISSHEMRTPQGWVTHAQSLGYKLPDYWKSVIQSNIVNQVAEVSLVQLQGQTGIHMLSPQNIACKPGAQGK